MAQGVYKLLEALKGQWCSDGVNLAVRYNARKAGKTPSRHVSDD
jgi:hypothetical protein